MKNNVLHVGWKQPPPPPFGFFKLNTNGSTRGNPSLALAGGLIRDHNGMWIGSFSRNIGFTHSMAAELWGLRDGLLLAKNLNIKKLMIETDAQTITNVLNSRSVFPDSPHPYLNIINDCESLLQCFEEARIDNIHREGNHCANILAKGGIHSTSAFYLHPHPPLVFCISLQLTLGVSRTLDFVIFSFV